MFKVSYFITVLHSEGLLVGVEDEDVATSSDQSSSYPSRSAVTLE